MDFARFRRYFDFMNYAFVNRQTRRPNKELTTSITLVGFLYATDPMLTLQMAIPITICGENVVALVAFELPRPFTLFSDPMLSLHVLREIIFAVY